MKARHPRCASTRTQTATRLLGSVAKAIALLAIANGARAVEIDTGNPDLTMRWDNTVRYNLGVRMKSQDDAILANANFDDGDRNFKRHGVVANRLDLLSEFDLNYRKMAGLRVSAAGWYDQAYASTSSANTSVATTNNLVGGVPTLGYNDYVKRYYKGPSGEFLDAFAFFKLEVGDTQVKLGRGVEYWGETLFGNTHGVSYAQMPLDGAKAIAIPGIEVKELFRPINNLSVRFSPADDITVAAQYFLDWEASRGPEPGTYLGPSDTGVNSGNYLRVAGPYATRLPDITPDKRGEYGISLRWAPSVLDATLGFYYRRFADKTGQVHLANIVPPGVPSNYMMVYADKIDLYGISLAKVVGSASVGLEISRRKNMPLVSDTVVIAPGKPLPDPGETYGARGNTWHAVANLITLLPAPPAVSTLTLQGELAYSRWDSVTSDPFNKFKGSDAYVATGKIDAVSKSNTTLALGLTPLWQAALPGVDLSLPLSYSVGLSGNSAVSGGGSKDAGSWSVGLSADIYAQYKVDLRYAGYFGKYTTSAAGAVAVYNGTQALLRDRGFVSLTLKTTF